MDFLLATYALCLKDGPRSVDVHLQASLRAHFKDIMARPEIHMIAHHSSLALDSCRLWHSSHLTPPKSPIHRMAQLIRSAHLLLLLFRILLRLGLVHQVYLPASDRLRLLLLLRL